MRTLKKINADLRYFEIYIAPTIEKFIDNNFKITAVYL